MVNRANTWTEIDIKSYVGAMALQGAFVGVVITPAAVLGGSAILAACIVASVVVPTYLATRRARRYCHEFIFHIRRS